MWRELFTRARAAGATGASKQLAPHIYATKLLPKRLPRQISKRQTPVFARRERPELLAQRDALAMRQPAWVATDALVESAVNVNACANRGLTVGGESVEVGERAGVVVFGDGGDRKSTRLNSSHLGISY